MPTSVRLDPETESLLKRLATSSGRSKSEVIREALHRLSEEPQRSREQGGLFDSIADLVGIADAGPEHLAREHKKRFRKKLGKRQR